MACGKRASANGEFSFSGVPAGEFIVEVRAPASRRDVGRSEPTAVTLQTGETCVLDLMLLPTAAVVGRVVDADGRPAIGARVALYPPGIRDPNLMQLAVVDREGAFRFDHVIDGPYAVGVGVATFRDDPTYAPAQAVSDGRGVFEVQAGATVDSGAIVTRRASPVVVTGRVQGGATDRLEGLGVYVLPVDLPDARAHYGSTTGTAGEFRLELLRDVRYRVFAAASGRRSDAVEFVAGDAPIVVPLRP